MRIFVVEPSLHSLEARRILEGLGEVEYAECAGQESFLSQISQGTYDALFTRFGLLVDAAVFEAVPSLRWIVTPTTGVEHIDVSEANRRKIRVISLRGEVDFLESVRSTAEHTWALLLALIRGIPSAFQDVLEGNWRRESFIGTELHGKTLGIVGCGRLGRMVAGYGLAFGMRVQAYDHDPANISKAPQGVEYQPLDVLMSNAEVVSLHLPLTDETRGFMSRQRIFEMKRHAILLNTARGELIDESALVEALTTGHLAGAALDVLAGDTLWEERTGQTDLLRYAKNSNNLIITPHVGGCARESLEKTSVFIAQRFAATVKEK